MVDVQTDLFFARRIEKTYDFVPKVSRVCQRTNPSGHQPLVLWPTFFNCHFDVSPVSPTGFTVLIRGLKTIGFNACPACGTDGSDALKPLVVTHAQLVRLRI